MSDTPKPGWLSFSIRDLLWLTTLVAVVVWSRYEHRNTPGRYTMELNQASYHTYVLDTATGKLCVRDSNGNWTDATPPALQKSVSP
jgi:hypothetical protein